MSVQWLQIEEEITAMLSATEFNEGGRMNKFLLKWGNRLVTEICQEIDIRKHLQTCTIVFTTADESKTLPEIFLKHSHRFTRVRASGSSDDAYIPIVGLDELLSYDPDRDETTTSIPDSVSIEGKRIYPYPLFAGTIILENYFRRPEKMTDKSGSPDLVDDDEDLLVNLLSAGVLKKGFLWLQDVDMVQYYSAEYNRLLDLYRLFVDASNSQIVEQSKYY